jgi:hypothetical protein
LVKILHTFSEVDGEEGAIMQESDWVEVEVGNQMEPRLDIQLQKVLISTYLVSI